METRKLEKNIFSVLALITVITLTSESAFSQVFDKGVKQANLGIGFGGGYGTGSTSPAISGSFEVGVTDKIGVGGIVGYQSSTYDYGFGSYSYTYLIFGARGSYHFYETDNVDVYGGAMLGYQNVSVSSTGSTFGAAASSSGIVIGLYLGGRYMFSENIGAFAELGYSISIFSVGLTAKF